MNFRRAGICNKWLDFGDDTDHDADPRIFQKYFLPLRYIGNADGLYLLERV